MIRRSSLFWRLIGHVVPHTSGRWPLVQFPKLFQGSGQPVPMVWVDQAGQPRAGISAKAGGDAIGHIDELFARAAHFRKQV